jgi:hypothetical protein
MLSFVGFLRTAVLISLVLCSAWSAAAEIRVGQSIDMSGVNGDLGKDFLAGARVYIDSINSAGGVHGKKIMLDVRDNQGSVEKSNQITHDFLTKDKVDVLFGYYGDNVVEATLALHRICAEWDGVSCTIFGGEFGQSGACLFYAA